MAHPRHIPSMIRYLALFAVATCLAAGEVTITTVDYVHQGTALRGVRAVPAGGQPIAGVLVVPEWWGMNDYAQRRARELAEHGYAAFACDMYGAGKVTMDPKEAGAWAGPFYADRPLMVARARAGLAELARTPGLDPARMSAIGFCFGGTVVLELARAGEPLQLAVSLHGGLSTPTVVAPGAIRSRILVLHGGSDPFVPPADVAAFITEMATSKADWNMQIYGGALHAFTNPQAHELHAILPGVDYAPQAEAQAFAAVYAALPH
jgi:dienelactone hydrolase